MPRPVPLASYLLDLGQVEGEPLPLRRLAQDTLQNETGDAQLSDAEDLRGFLAADAQEGRLWTPVHDASIEAPLDRPTSSLAWWTTRHSAPLRFISVRGRAVRRWRALPPLFAVACTAMREIVNGRPAQLRCRGLAAADRASLGSTITVCAC